MVNNLMLWVQTLGPLFDAFQRDQMPFYPMVWNASSPDDSNATTEMFSVLVSPGGKVLVEIASSDSGGRERGQFNRMAHARAVLDSASSTQGHNERVSNDPIPGTIDFASRPLAPLRISRAVGGNKTMFDAVLDFYSNAALGFSGARILRDETHDSGDRAVTIMLSPNATVHLQLWARKEDIDATDDESNSAPFPSIDDFDAAVDSNQINGGQPEGAAAFCASGAWNVARYIEYVLNTHKTVMTAAPVASKNDDAMDLLMHPPAGNSFDVFIDDHMSWDCTSPIECDKAQGGAAFYAIGSRVQWLGNPESGWTAYSYDPSGYGFELHWFAAPEGFMPSGVVSPSCFTAFSSNGTCSGVLL
jgi:hypothetical protein